MSFGGAIAGGMSLSTVAASLAMLGVGTFTVQASTVQENIHFFAAVMYLMSFKQKISGNVVKCDPEFWQAGSVGHSS